MPWCAKALGVFIAAYAFSPIDLIPDFIPILGLVDDAIILPIAIWLAVKMIPPEIMAEHRKSAAIAATKPVSRTAATIIVGLWAATAAATAWILFAIYG